MPWTGQSFATKHNKALHGAKANHAARIANAVLRSGVPEGESIAIASKWAKHHAVGGGIDDYQEVGATMNDSGQSAAPFVGSGQPRNNYPHALTGDRYLPPDPSFEGRATDIPTGDQATYERMRRQLFELPTNKVHDSFESPRGRQKLQGGGDVEPLDALVARLSPKIPKRASGGFLHGSTPGRADSITTSAPGGSYVIPAAVVSGIGQGNSLAGAKVIQDMLERGPYGIPMPHGRAGNNIPSPPHPRAEYQAGGSIPIFQKGSNPQESPVMLSDGEFVVTRQQVLHWGGGNLKRGHRIFDKWVVKKKKELIAELEKLPGPVKT